MPDGQYSCHFVKEFSSARDCLGENGLTNRIAVIFFHKLLFWAKAGVFTV